MKVPTLAAAASLASVASARIYGISVPTVIAPGDLVNIILETGNYIQSVYDVSVAFGVSPGEGYPGTIGTIVGSQYLGPGNSNVLRNITVPIAIPDTLAKGESLFSASLFSIYGASGSPTLTSFNVTINVGDNTTTTYVSSQV